MRLNLGCGLDRREGWVNVDQATFGLSGIVAVDLDEVPWPWDGLSVDEVLLDNVLEHLRDPESAIREMARVMRPGARATIIVPHYLSPAAHRPNHRSTWSLSSFNEFDAEDHGGRKGLDASPFFKVVEAKVMHRRPHGLWLERAVPVLRPQKIRFVLRKRYDP